MFENVREDIRLGVAWHSVPKVRRLLGETAETIACIALSAELQVVLIYRFQAWARGNGIPLVPNLCRRLHFCGLFPDDGSLAEFIRVPARTCFAVPDTIDDAEAALLARTRAAAKATDEYVHGHPWQAIGIAASVGVVVGLLIGRR